MEPRGDSKFGQSLFVTVADFVTRSEWDFHSLARLSDFSISGLEADENKFWAFLFVSKQSLVMRMTQAVFNLNFSINSFLDIPPRQDTVAKTRNAA